jgi:hypothetical protein
LECAVDGVGLRRAEGPLHVLPFLIDSRVRIDKVPGAQELT